MTSQKIILETCDKQVFEVDLKVAQCSNTIKQLLEDLGMDEVGQEQTIPLPNVTAYILGLVLKWAEHHKDDPVRSSDDDVDQEKRTDNINDWDLEFLKVDQATLFELILAANYLDVKGLMEITCKSVANMIKGSKSTEEIRKLFNVENDFTAEEEAQLQKENQWMDEK